MKGQQRNDQRALRKTTKWKQQVFLIACSLIPTESLWQDKTAATQKGSLFADRPQRGSPEQN